MTRLVIKKAEPLEKDIQNSICEYLSLKKHFFWRQNNTPIAQGNGHGGYFFRAMSKYALKGVPDIICFDKTGTGIAIFLEVKRPSGKQSVEQKTFENLARGVGAEYYVVRSIDDLIQIGL